MKQPPFVEEGPCEICHERPADYLGIVCSFCKDAIDNGEEWTVAYDEVLFRLR